MLQLANPAVAELAEGPHWSDGSWFANEPGGIVRSVTPSKLAEGGEAGTRLAAAEERIVDIVEEPASPAVADVELFVVDVGCPSLKPRRE